MQELTAAFFGAILLVAFMHLTDATISKVFWALSFFPLALVPHFNEYRFLVGSDKVQSGTRALAQLGGLDELEALQQKLVGSSVVYGIIGPNGFTQADKDLCFMDKSGTIVFRLFTLNKFFGPLCCMINPVVLLCSHARGVTGLATPVAIALLFSLYISVTSQTEYAMAEGDFKRLALLHIDNNDHKASQVQDQVTQIREVAIGLQRLYDDQRAVNAVANIINGMPP